MKKLFLKLTDSKNRYWIFKDAQTKNFLLSDLVFFLEAWGSKDISWLHQYSEMTWESIHLSKKDNNTIYLYNSDNIKQRANVQFETQEKKENFYELYRQYSKKRWQDMPILYMSIKNYEEIVQKWQDIVLKQRPNYIILSQNDAGYVDLIGKDELSQQDLADMKIEHEKYLKYKAAYDKYTKSRPDITDELWHGPESSEYEADWQKFLDEPLD